MRVLATLLTALHTAPLLPQAPTPPPEMHRLAKVLVGTWSTTEQHEPGDIAPRGGVGRGTVEVRLGPGGMSLITDYTAVDPSGTFRSHSIMWWDATEQAYHGVECYNRSRAGCEATLWRWDGTDLVSQEHGLKEVFTQFTPTSHTFYMDGSSDGGPVKRIMTIRFIRIKGPKP